jgi:hypothetical protein
MTDHAKLEALLDKQAIAEVVGPRYARALDWLDVEALRTCFWPDGWVDYGFFEGNSHEWCDIVMPIESGSLNRFHYTFNPLIVVDGDTAEAESSGFAGSRRQTDDGIIQTFHGSRYLDRVEQRHGEWRISERRVLLELTQRFPSPDGPGGALGGLDLISGLGPDHPLYRRL